jgi:hypothetical protein
MHLFSGDRRFVSEDQNKDAVGESLRSEQEKIRPELLRASKRGKAKICRIRKPDPVYPGVLS